MVYIVLPNISIYEVLIRLRVCNLQGKIIVVSGERGNPVMYINIMRLSKEIV